MINFNSYNDGLDLSVLNEYCVNNGRLTQYAKGDYFIKAGTSCKVFQLAGEELCKLLDSDGKRVLKQDISDHLFSQVYTQYLDTYRMTTRERYKRLLLRCPEIVQSINLKDIASYLRVTPTTISNIRREITFGL